MNRLRGEGVSIALNGQMYGLRYDWDALARLDARFPDGLDLKDPETLAEVVAIGIADPEVTAETVKAASPPVMPTIDAVTRAHNLAYYGHVEAEEASHPPRARRAGSKTFFRWLFGRAFSRISSGA